jgi:diguanylate cyclase (GGDEF)-like protein
MSKPVKSHEEDLVFLDEMESPTTPAHHTAGEVWRIMIIDDDADVHSATTFALSNLEMQRRPLEFLHAYSAQQARELLKVECDIAVILLDVVMEQEDAGLHLVRYIRDDLGLTEARIILRTGQPGYAPEIDAIRDYDINDYKTKSELTRIKLYTTVTAAIRSYEQIRAINASRRGLDMIVHASTELMALHGLESFAAGVITQIAGLLSLHPEGLLCVREYVKDDGCELVVIAAAGDYRDLINKPIRVLHDERINTALERALTTQCNVYENDFTALYFQGNGERDFAAFLNTGSPLKEIDRQLLEVFCSNISVGLDNVELVSRLHNFAFYDQLTKLPNRTRLIELIDDTLNGAARNDTTLALIDIDHFAEINDALGHHFGDQLLLSVAARLQAGLGGRVHVARVGGDIFAVLGNNDVVNPQLILAQFDRPFSVDLQCVQLSSTIGLVLLAEYDGGGADALKDGDIALKRAKLQQRTGHFYFSSRMGVDIRERVRMMHALREGFDKRELFVVYQPQVDLKTRKVVGAESLLRWKMADGTFIPPDRFIPIAEYSGIIIDLGAWVMREACLELVRLHSLGFTSFSMAINVSMAQFRHPHFMDMLRATLDETKAPPSFIELEITESMAMEEPETLVKMLDQIKQTGVTIAIDDFGTGFSSLSFLQQLHVDKLKIDRAFVTEITNSSRGSSIAEMVAQLGRNLGLAVIAEGVEDETQANILDKLGCPLAQGYLFAKPMTPDLLREWLKKAE